MPLPLVEPQGAPVVVSGGAGSPDLVGYSDADPCPRTEITVAVTGTQSVTVWRTVVVGSASYRAKVRGADNVSAQAAFFVTDYETPLAQTVSYTVQLDGGPESAASTVFIPQTYAWIQDPLAPTLAAPLSLVDGDSFVGPGSMAAATYGLPVELVSILGSAYPVALGGTRQVATRVPFDVFCQSAEAAGTVSTILTGAFPVLLRPLPSMPVFPPAAFLSVAEVVVEPQDAHLGGTLTRWSLVGDLVAGPSVRVVVPVWTYGDVADLWATYGDVAATGRTYLDMQRDPRP